MMTTKTSQASPRHRVTAPRPVARLAERAGRLLATGAMLLLTLFSVAVAAPAIAPEYFGMHIFYPHLTTKWPGTSFGSLRIWDCPGATWAEIEPSRGQWNFSALDRIVDLADENRVSVLYTLGQTPAWASARPAERSARGPGRAAEPADAEDWATYVRTVATRYRGRIQAYEIWNEPRFGDLYPWRGTGFYSGSAKSMVTLSRIAYQVIKEVDPAAIVVSPAMDGESIALRKFDRYLAEGGGKWFDVVGWHYYMSSSDAPEALATHHDELRSLLARHNLPDKPIWNTETGVMVNHGKPVKPMDPPGILSKVMTPTEAANYMVRAMIVLAAAGAERFYWFAWDSASMGVLSSLPPRAPSEIAYAYDALRRWLVGARLGSCRVIENSVWECPIQRGPRLAHIVWSAQGERSLVVPQDWNVRAVQALFGGTEPLAGAAIRVFERPVLLKAETDDWN
jgi:hypothetical protein